MHLENILTDVEHFQVTVSHTPSKEADEADWHDWRPDFSAYDVVLLVYNGAMWPDEVRSNFESYIREGGTALLQHASNNPFQGWAAFEEMTGLLWRGAAHGYRVYMDNQGNVVREPPGKGLGAGHGKLHDWSITSRMPEHPILKDLPPVWLHPHDELYHGQRGPAENMHILATAYSDTENGGSGTHEPMLWWIPWGEGKVLTLLPGHLWGGQKDDRALRCVGFRTLLQRSVEWLATGTVKSRVPDNFPSRNTTSIVPRKDAPWITLFDGKSLDGWKASENPSSFSVQDGAIVVHGPRAHLFYTGTEPDEAIFHNFHFKADVMTSPGANSGLYFHTTYQEEGWPSKGYEAQVNNTYKNDPRKTGSLYGLDDVMEAPVSDNEWFTQHIIVQGKRIIIKINDTTVVDYTEESPTGNRKLDKGTFALQAHDPDSRVLYRNIAVKRLP